MAETAEFGARKTIFILAIVAGCFAVLWPKIFYPMLTASVISQPTPSDASTCCDVIFESDVNAVDIMQEMCENIIRHHQVDPRVREVLRTRKLTPQSASLCREEVLARCGIDLSSFLAERERLGKSYKQVLEEIRSFNSSLCLKMNFGVPLSQLGTPHLIRYHILMPHIFSLYTASPKCGETDADDDLDERARFTLLPKHSPISSNQYFTMSTVKRSMDTQFCCVIIFDMNSQDSVCNEPSIVDIAVLKP